MLTRCLSGLVHAVRGELVEMEIHVGRGLPGIALVGRAGSSVKESTARVRAAMTQAGFAYPRQKIVVNLAPADLPKNGALLDLPLAVGLVATDQGWGDGGLLERYLVLGELALDGSVRPVRGVLPIAQRARERDLAGLLVPADNASEAAVVSRAPVYGVRTLEEAVLHLTGKDRRPAHVPELELEGPGEPEPAVDFAQVRGQTLAKRALLVAAAGGHNVFLTGPPGSGKTLLARALAGILPPLTREEAIETTAIHSVSRHLEAPLVERRPFRAPHHTVSEAGFVGGGVDLRPGEVSLAHNGVLFLDETLEFPRRLLDLLRQPLEERRIDLARLRRAEPLPAHILLVLAANPCPCGYLTHPRLPCRCTTSAIRRYRDRLSGPVRDRIDLAVEVGPLDSSEFFTPGPSTPSWEMRTRVLAARARQESRYGDTGFRTNADASGETLEEACRLDAGERGFLREAMDRYQLSARGASRVLRVARTIADLADEEAVGEEHLAEALAFRGEG